MPQYRQNPLTREWVIIGSERQARPNEFVEQTPQRQGGLCPFCAGNESETPGALATYSAPGSDQWAVRVVPNKYPAVSPCDSSENGSASCGQNELFFPSALALGQHEVIIESSRHVSSITQLTAEESRLLFVAYRDRLLAHKKDGKFPYVQIFKNVGLAAGASIEHSHSQLIALAQVPEKVAQEVAFARQFAVQNETGLQGSILAAELTSQERVIAQSTSFVAYCPWASRFPYELAVVPRRAGPSYENLQDGELGELAAFMQEVVGRMESALGSIAYNFFLRSAPFDISPRDHYHWHIEIFPRLVKVAGFEWSTGVFVNTVAPEAAAQSLRLSPPQPSGKP